jgi:DNA-binding MarR family transcriptional regulator
LETQPENIAAQLRPLLTRIVRKLRKVSPVAGSLSQTERSVMVLLEQQGPLLSAELAVIEKITPQSMGQVLNNLAALDFIDKTPSLTDKRKVHISLSDKGRGMIEKVRGERNEWLTKAISQTCTPQEQEALLNALTPLAKLIDFD